MLKHFDFSKPVSLYIHVPFCVKKCGYCAFFSKPQESNRIKELYTDKIVLEIEELVSKMEGPFYTAFIGGGNPGCLSVSQLERICKAVCLKGRPVEFTTEMNPESLCEDHFLLFEKYLTRLSMGVQSLEQSVLSFLQRNTSLNETLNGVSLACKLKEQVGCDLNFDFITCTGIDDTSYRRLAFADHLSVYCLTPEEGTPVYSKIDMLPDNDKQFEILKSIWNDLSDLGFEHYEVSNFAKKGKECLHNQVYWSYGQYVGLGPASASTGFVNGIAYRINFEPSIEKYLSCKKMENYVVEELTQDEKLEEFTLMGLRHTKGLDLLRLKTEFGIEKIVPPEGYKIHDSFLCPDEKGLMTADNAAMMLTSQFTV